VAASQRLLIASLYCGTGKGREGKFVEALGQVLGSLGPKPTTEVLLDALRGTRPSKDPAGERPSSFPVESVNRKYVTLRSR
jgi:hypothetical protein